MHDISIRIHNTTTVSLGHQHNENIEFAYPGLVRKPYMVLNYAGEIMRNIQAFLDYVLELHDDIGGCPYKPSRA